MDRQRATSESIEPKGRSTKSVQQVRVVVVREKAERYAGALIKMTAAKGGQAIGRFVLDSPEAVQELPFIAEEMLSSDRERFICLHLNTKNWLLSWEVVSIGSLNATVVHPREVFKAAILANAAAVVLCHNHPSGDPEPSGADLQLTRRLVKAGDVIGIEVLDHVVLTETGFVSLRERGMM